MYNKFQDIQTAYQAYFYAIFMRRNTQFSCVEIRIKKAAFAVLSRKDGLNILAINLLL
jgi:hypothetical protein